MRQPDAVPDNDLPLEYSKYIDYFYDLRGFCSEASIAIQPSLIADWQSHSGVHLHRWERDCIFGMDRAFRRSHANVVSYHASRKPINLEDDDVRKMSKSGRK